MPQAKTPPHLITLILLAAFAPLSLNMFLPSLANIADDLATDYATVSLAISGYLAVTAVIQLVVGPLSDRFGRRPMILAALCLFTGASLGCALSTDVWAFLAFRMLQGGIVSGFALAMAIVRDTRSERAAASLLGYISMAMGVAPMLGPMLGGVLDTAFGWRSSFYFYAISGTLLFILCVIDLGETNPQAPSEKAEDRETVITLLKEPLFWAFSLCNTFSVGAFFIFLTGAPLVASKVFGMSAAELGFYIGTITAGFIVGGFISGRFGPRFQLTTLVIVGRLIACAGLTIGILLLLAGHLSPTLFFGSTIAVGLGNGLTTPNCNAGLISVRPKLAGSAAGLNGALVLAVGAILTTLTGILLPEDEPALMLLIIMLSASVVGLLMILWAFILRRKAGLVEQSAAT